MSKEFDKKINQKISESEIAPSAGLWEKIEAELPQEKRKKGFFILPLFGTPMFKTAIAASVMFLLGGFSTYYFMNNNAPALANKNNVESNTNKQFIKQNNLNKENNNLEDKNKFQAKNNTKQESLSTNFLSKKANNNKAATTKSASVSNKFANSKNPALIFNNNIVASNNSNANLIFGTQARDYTWVYDENTGAYSVQLKSEQVQNTNFEDNSLMANTINQENENETSFMSLAEEEKEEKLEILEENEEEPVLKAFNSKTNRINYQGFWLGPKVGFEGVFVADEFYPGGSFGVDVGYDFASSWGIQTGLKYALNSKMIKLEQDGKTIDYKSEFNSLHIPLYARYKFTKLTQAYSKPLSLNIVGGLDYAYADRKKLHQLGLNLGAEYDIFTQADLMLTVGARAGIYNNLNLNKIDAPEKINRYNYMLSAYLSVRFIDWAKKN